MTKRPERVHATLFVPGRLPDMEAWRRALDAKGLVLTQDELSGATLPFAVDIEWVDNPQDGSFGQAFSFGTASQSEQREIDAALGALVLSLHVDLHRERTAIASLARTLAACGALAVRVEESKLGFPVERWIERIGGKDPWSLYRAVVVVLGGEDRLRSCGMHVFSLPDAQIQLDNGTDPKELNELLGVLNVYQLAEDPVLVSGHTFSPAADAPKRVLQRWPDATYPASHACHNPFGVWRLGPPGSAGQARDTWLVFIPALATVLTSAEQKVERPLTREEVEKITSNSVCMVMEHRDAQTLERSRGYADIDPELAWEQWQIVRAADE